MQYFTIAAFAAGVSAWDLSPSDLNVWQGHSGAKARGGNFVFSDASGNSWSNGTGSCVIDRNLAEWSDATLFSNQDFYIRNEDGEINFYNLRDSDINDFVFTIEGSDSEVAWSNSTASYENAISCQNDSGLNSGDLLLGNFPNVYHDADVDGNVSGRGNVACFQGAWPATFTMNWGQEVELSFDDERVFAEAVADTDGGFSVIADTVTSNEIWFNYTINASFEGSHMIELA